jgi:hypothetical protein
MKTALAAYGLHRPPKDSYIVHAVGSATGGTPASATFLQASMTVTWARLVRSIRELLLALRSRVIIPYQKPQWQIPDPQPINRAWWRPILETADYKTMERQEIWEDKRTGKCVPIDYHVWKWVNRAVVEAAANHGDSLRKELERRYQKVWSTAT